MSWRQTPSWQRCGRLIRRPGGLLAWAWPVAVASRWQCVRGVHGSTQGMLQVHLCHQARQVAGCGATRGTASCPVISCPASRTILASWPLLFALRRRLTQRSRRTTSWCPELRAQLAPDCCWSAGQGGGTPPAALDRWHAGVAACTAACTASPACAPPLLVCCSTAWGSVGSLTSLPRAVEHWRGPEARPPRAARSLAGCRLSATCNKMNERLEWQQQERAAG